MLGYDAGARITREAMARGIAPREAAVELGLITAAEYDRLVDLRAMAGLPPA